MEDKMSGSDEEDTQSEELEIDEPMENQLKKNKEKYEYDTDNEDEWPDAYKSGFKEVHANSNSKSNPPPKSNKRAAPFNGLPWEVIEAKLGQVIQEYIKQYETKYQDPSCVNKISEGKLPLSFNVVTRNHKTVLGQFWKFIQYYEPKHALSLLDVISKTRLLAFSKFLTSRYNEPQTISNKLGHLSHLLTWMGEHADFIPHHKHITECRTYIRRLSKPFERAKRENKTVKQNSNQAKGRNLTKAEIDRIQLECETDLSEYQLLADTIEFTQKMDPRKFAFEFQTRLQILLLLEKDIQTRDVIVNIAQYKVKKLGVNDAPSEQKQIKADPGQAPVISNTNTPVAIPPKEEIGADSAAITELVISVLCNAAVNQHTTGARAGCADESKELDLSPPPKHNPAKDIALPPKLFDWFNFFKDKVRPHLCPLPTVEYAWVACQSGCVQQSNQMTQAIQNVIGEKLPGKKIGPLDLKRSMTEARRSKIEKSPKKQREKRS